MHTGQFFFPEDVLGQLETLAPYSFDDVKRTLNKDDHDFNEDPSQIVNISLSNPGSINSGATASINVVIDQYMAETEPAGKHNVMFS